MKYFLQQIILAAVSFFIVSQIFPGLVLGNVYSYAYSALLLVLGFAFVRPIITTITLPIAALTFNLTTFLSTVIIIFLISLLNPLFDIRPFTFSGVQILGYVVPSFQANIFLSYLIISATIHITYKILFFVFDL